VLSPTLDTVRLFLHVLAASVWVGGQLVLGGIVPSVRASAPEALRPMARAFGRLAWPAFAVLVLTGVWGLVEIDVASTTTDYQVTLFLKILLALASGAAAVVHQVGRSRAALAVGGAVGLLGSLGALFLAFVLTTGS
jgi:putative copper export protein